MSPIEVHDILAERFRVNLRNLMTKQRLSQPALAAIANVNAEYVGQLCRGHRKPTLDMIELLARALDVDPSRLLREVP